MDVQPVGVYIIEHAPPRVAAKRENFQTVAFDCFFGLHCAQYFTLNVTKRHLVAGCDATEHQI